MKTVAKSAMRLGFLVFLAGCVEPSGYSSGRYSADGAFGNGGGRNAMMQRVDRAGSIETSTLSVGTDQYLGNGGADSSIKSHAIVTATGDKSVEISLVNASIEAASKAVLGDTLGLNYVVSPGLTGQITIQTTSPVPTSILLELFEAALSANNAQLRKEGNVVNVVPGSNGNTTFRVAGASGSNASSILVAPLKFISAAEMAKMLSPLTDQGLNVVIESKRNLLLLSGTSGQLDAALDALNLFDVDVLKGKSVALVQLRSADPDALVKELQGIFEAEEGGMLNGVIEFIPNPRLSSVLIISSRSTYIDRAQSWISKLDKSASENSFYLATYELQNRSAAEVSPLLADLLGGTSTNSAEGESEVGEFSQAVESDKPRVTADDTRNTIIVRAKREDHEQIEGILRSLDSPTRQILMEATIAEVSLTDEISIGTRWFFESGNWDFRSSDLQNGGVSGSNPGFTAVFGAGGANLALSALAGVTDVKVISSPTLMVVDNKEGLLQIGDQVPIAVQKSSGAENPNAPVLTQVEYRDTGVILRVRPRVGAGGKVLLEISQEVSDVSNNKTSGIDSPTIRQRKVQTTVSLVDGQTLALGGLIQEGNSSSRSEVPGAGRIPVLGNLFRSKSGRKGRTELLILIRPRVVSDEQDAISATNYWRSKVSGPNSMIATGLGAGQHTVFDYSN
jgi:general secretion pathway protein D